MKASKSKRIKTSLKLFEKSHFVGRRGDLEFYAERYPRGFRIEFFQNVNFENPNGGRYDFEKISENALFDTASIHKVYE